MYRKVIKELKKEANPIKAKILARFFKTGKGEYGEGDKFLGIMVPKQRKLVKKYFKELSFNDVQELLNSDIHEFRLTGVLFLVAKYQSINRKEIHKRFSLSPHLGESKEDIFKFYLKNLKVGNINNWDLVDLSAPNIVGDYLFDKNKQVLYNMVKSQKIWERRVSVIATLFFIRQKDFSDILKIAKLLLKDRHDLIQKAVGWMLREVGKRDKAALLSFLEDNADKMPRVMLRYSIEKFDKDERLKYMLFRKKY